MGENLRLLSIGAHPADIFDQSGGAMAHHVARGDWVGCVVLTRGARIHDKVISNDMFHAESVPEGEKLEALMRSVPMSRPTRCGGRAVCWGSRIFTFSAPTTRCCR